MISTQKDILINYVENPNVYSEDSRNTLVVCDVLAKMIAVAPFCKKITGLEDLLAITTEPLNPAIFRFGQMFFGLSARPEYFWLAAESAEGSSGFLKSGTLDAWDIFKQNFVSRDVPDIYTPLTFLITATSGDIACNYKVSGTELLAMNSYEELIDKLQHQNEDNLTVSLQDGMLVVSTVEIGAVDGTLSYMSDSEATVDEGGYIVGGANIGIFAEYKRDHENCVFNVVDGAGENIMNVNIPTAALNSWTELAGAITAAAADALIVKYNTDHLTIYRTLRGAASTLAAAGARGTDAEVLKLTTDDGATVHQGAADVAAVQHAAVLLKGTEATATDKQDGKNNIGKLPVFMQSFKKIIDQQMLDPALLVLSPNITLDAASGATDLDTTKNMMRGFSQYFSYAQTGMTTCAISIGSTVYLRNDAEVQTGAFDDMRNDVNARNYFINYHKNVAQSLDGAVAAYCASFAWDETNALHDIFCKSFIGIDPDATIDDGVDTMLKDYAINFYGQMSNGDSAYRYGLTLSNGDVGNIITAVGVNAFLKSVRSSIIKLRKQEDLKLNGNGSTAIYAAIAGVCDSFVANGFLSPISFRENGKTTALPAYEIQLLSSFSRANVTANAFPPITVKILPTVYAKQITINISNELWS